MCNCKNPLKFDLFTVMVQKRVFSVRVVCCIYLLFLWGCTDKTSGDEDFSEGVKIALREVGHHLLMADGDSTSLVLPIVQYADTRFRLTFDKTLSLKPDDLVAMMLSSFEKVHVLANYRAAIIRCQDHEVAYSCQINQWPEDLVIPCSGRTLPKDCYEIDIHFLSRNDAHTRSGITVLLVFLCLCSSIYYFLGKRKSSLTQQESPELSFGVGGFLFYPDQNKLLYGDDEIHLTKKECEILEVFAFKPNKLITRNELSKRVWEDQGVLVGRSLDTYISKLRKKLAGDPSIRLTNIHGVGYKLETS